jgi:hypothetical protein
LCPSCTADGVDDLTFVSTAHREYLPGGFLAELGDSLLRSYCLSFIPSPASVALIGEAGGEPADHFYPRLGGHQSAVLRGRNGRDWTPFTLDLRR